MSQPLNRDEAAKELLRELYRDLRSEGSSGRIEEAAAFLSDDVDPKWQASIANILAHHHFHAGQHVEALHYCQKWLACDPDNPTAVSSFLGNLARLKRWDAVIETATENISRRPRDFRLHGSLCEALGKLGRLNEARAHGTLCLTLKDQSTKAEAFDLSGVRVPVFDQTDRTRNIISFSLFGDGEKYLKGAVANARATQFIYPDWTCRFYIDDTVPRNIVQILGAEGAELRTVQGLPNRKYGTFWRFLAAEDPTVDRYVVRDCDSVVNVRERVAVDEWIESGRHFHVMRDYYSHTELMLAGMWSGVTGALPPMGRLFCHYVEQTFQHRALDQEFLREMCWPTIRQSALIHDSQFAFGERRDFPRLGRLPSGQHVGVGAF